MLAPKSEVWHRKGFAVQPNGFSPGFRHGGEVYKPGASTIIRTNWQWTIKGEKQSGRISPQPGTTAVDIRQFGGIGIINTLERHARAQEAAPRTH